MRMFRQKIKGVTLLEVMLVLAIASSLLVLMLNYTTQKADELRRDKTVLQMQQILNAAMNYYVTHSAWPVYQCGEKSSPTWSPMNELIPDYLPYSLQPNAYGQQYLITCSNVSNGGGFYVATSVNNAANAAIIAGRLPLAYRIKSFDTLPPPACTTGPDCTSVIASVNIPGQNLNNARSVNFASVYYSGSCVPAPNCPPNMKPNILVMPAAVSGVNDGPSCTSQGNVRVCTGKVNPVSSFTAFALGGVGGNPVDPNNKGPYGCLTNQIPTPCVKNTSGGIITSDGTLYWRVCLKVSTDQGLINPRGTGTSQSIQDHGKTMGSLVAITRCVPNQGDENPSGSIDVWQR